MKKNILFLLSCVAIFSGCNAGNGGGNNEPHNDNPPEPQQEQTEDTVTKTIHTSGASFKAVFPNKGTQFDSGSQVSNQTKLQNFIAGQLDNTDYLSSIECTSLNVCDWKATTHLQFGSQKNTGSFVWHSIKKILKVEVSVMNYGTLNTSTNKDLIDLTSHVVLCGEDTSLEIAEGVDPTPTTISKEFEQGVYKFDIASLKGRILVESMTITWDNKTLS